KPAELSLGAKRGICFCLALEQPPEKQQNPHGLRPSVMTTQNDTGLPGDAQPPPILDGCSHGAIQSSYPEMSLGYPGREKHPSLQNRETTGRRRYGRGLRSCRHSA